MLVAKLIEEAGAEISNLSPQEVDITEHPEAAVKYGVMFMPAIAINGRLAFTEIPSKADLRHAILSF